LIKGALCIKVAVFISKNIYQVGKYRMRPLSVITGIVAGSCLSITVSLAAVLIVYLVLGDDYPRVRHEFGPLLASMSLFFGMTAISGASFYALLINHKLVLLSQALMWLGLAGTAYYYVA
jgi:hypothetical protein